MNKRWFIYQKVQHNKAKSIELRNNGRNHISVIKGSNSSYICEIIVNKGIKSEKHYAVDNKTSLLVLGMVTSLI